MTFSLSNVAVGSISEEMLSGERDLDFASAGRSSLELESGMT